ncbi:MAG: hypothetical protein P8173_04610 [Gammaproteobacteria bacterium]
MPHKNASQKPHSYLVLMHPMLARIPTQFKILLIFLLWGGLVLLFHLLRFDPYGIEEPAARALLLNWTVADQVVNPIVVFGLPDLRVLLFAPLGIYWSGSIVAVKVFTLIIAFAACLLLYRWARRLMNEEVALIGTGLLLIAPLTFFQVNTVGVGPFLLLLFALGQWLDEKYRQSGRQLGGWYFLQMILAAVAVSLHPAGLAYPLALMWEWYKNPIDKRHRIQVMAGLAISTVLILILRLGWPALQWGNNPMAALTDLVYVMGPASKGPTWVLGFIPSGILLLLVLSDLRELFRDLLGRMLLGGLLFGIVAAGPGWAMLGLAIMVYRGLFKLININQGLQAGGLMGQRGIVLIAVFALATTYMINEKVQRYDIRLGAVSPQDDIIRTLSGELEDLKKPAATISQWPARTLLATKHTTFPLPPPAPNAQALLKNLHGAHFLIFDPYDKSNAQLTRQVSELALNLKTIMVKRDAVLVEIVDTPKKDATSAKHS